MRNKSGLILSVALLFSNASFADTPWTYEGIHNGQQVWPSLSKDYLICDSGIKQSPVVIGSTEVADLPAMIFSYKSSKLTIRALEQMIRIDVEAGNTLALGNEIYHLKAIELHSPSEHMVRDRFHLMEIHLVHEDTQGKKLHVAVFVDSGGAHSALDTLAAGWPKAIGQTRDATMDPAALLPSSLGYYAYSGSLTYPPCTENVEWRVLKQPIAISNKQLSTFSRPHGRSARLEQPIYGRTIYETSY
ncbi:MAG: carbonic anhydrase family protein [Alphaproteobacteria bacterium]|nr:carbonic anhydrase family protein [Alphaproteobacteria bacterium]